MCYLVALLQTYFSSGWRTDKAGMYYGDTAASFVFCFSNNHRSLTSNSPLFIIKSTTLLSHSSHCKHAEFSTVPLTLTVSICPFTDRVLGGVLLEAETLTAEREMWICNNITGNKKRHYERAIAGSRIKQFLLGHWFNQRETVGKVPLQLWFHHFRTV